MSDKTFRIMLPLLVLLLSVALVVQGFSGLQRRQAICDRSNATLDVLHDVIAIATAPQPGKTLTAAQVWATTAFQVKVYSRINSARC